MDQSIHTEYILIRYSIYFDIKLCLVAWISIIDFSIYFGDFRLSSVGCVARQANEAWTDLEKTLFLPDIFGQLGSGDVEGASHRGAALRPFVGSTASCASHHQGCTNDHCPMHWASVISCNFFQVVLWQAMASTLQCNMMFLLQYLFAWWVAATYHRNISLAWSQEEMNRGCNWWNSCWSGVLLSDCSMLEVASSYTRAASVVFPSTQNLPPDLMSRGLPPDFSGRPQPLRSLKFHTFTYTLHLLMIIDV